MMEDSRLQQPSQSLLKADAEAASESYIRTDREKEPSSSKPPVQATLDMEGEDGLQMSERVQDPFAQSEAHPATESTRQVEASTDGERQSQPLRSKTKHPVGVENHHDAHMGSMLHPPLVQARTPTSSGLMVDGSTLTCREKFLPHEHLVARTTSGMRGEDGTGVNKETLHPSVHSQLRTASRSPVEGTYHAEAHEDCAVIDAKTVEAPATGVEGDVEMGEEPASAQPITQGAQHPQVEDGQKELKEGRIHERSRTPEELSIRKRNEVDSIILERINILPSSSDAPSGKCSAALFLLTHPGQAAAWYSSAEAWRDIDVQLSGKTECGLSDKFLSKDEMLESCIRPLMSETVRLNQELMRGINHVMAIRLKVPSSTYREEFNLAKNAFNTNPRGKSPAASRFLHSFFTALLCDRCIHAFSGCEPNFPRQNKAYHDRLKKRIGVPEVSTNLCETDRGEDRLSPKLQFCAKASKSYVKVLRGFIQGWKEYGATHAEDVSVGQDVSIQLKSAVQKYGSAGVLNFALSNLCGAASGLRGLLTECSAEEKKANRTLSLDDCVVLYAAITTSPIALLDGRQIANTGGNTTQKITLQSFAKVR